MTLPVTLLLRLILTRRSKPTSWEQFLIGGLATPEEAQCSSRFPEAD